MAGVIKEFNLDPFGAGHFVSGDHDPNRCNEQVFLKAAAGDLETGRVLGKVTSGGAYAAHDPALSDGTQTAVAILWQGRPNKAGGTTRAAIVARDTVVNGNLLTWKTGISGSDKTAAIAALALQGIIVRF